MKILLAVDGSEHSAKAIDYLLTKSGLAKENHSVHLLNVRLPIPNDQGRLAALSSQKEIDQYQKEEAEAVLAPAEEILSKGGYAVAANYVVGDPAQEINNFSREKHIDLIVMGSHGRNALHNLVLGSVATKVLALSHIPVLIIR